MAKKPKEKTQDGAEGAPAGDGVAKGGLLKNKKVLLIGGGGLVIVILVAVGAAFALGLFSPKPKVEVEQHGTMVAGEQAPERPKTPTFMELPELTVNLTSNSPKAQYLRIRISLEVADANVASQIQPLLPRVYDAFQVFLRELRTSDLEGSAAVFKLKEELVRRVNLAVQPAHVDAVLLRDILVQ